MDVPRSTLTGLAEGNTRASVWGRRVFIVLMLLFVIAGVTGLLGTRSATKTATEGDYTVSVQYARIARAGLDVPWQVTVTRAGGFSGPITLAVSAQYFDIFESQGFSPEPSDETATGDTLYLTFDKPPGDTLQVSYDIYVQPSSQEGHSGQVSVIAGGRPVATVGFTTTLVP